jgi:DNA-binding IclR family transcriptional regulator
MLQNPGAPEASTARAAYPGTQAVRRAIAVIKALSSARGKMPLAALARATNLNKTTAFRILSALESEGMVERDGVAGYGLGPELCMLGGRADSYSDLSAVGRDHLPALAAATGETASLEILVDRDVLIVEEAMGAYMLGLRPSVGSRWPAHATATGKALLAHLSDAHLSGLLSSRLPKLTPRTIVDPQTLARELARVRQRGYSTNIEELEPDFVALGAPVRRWDGRVVAAVSIGGPRGRLPNRRLATYAKQLITVADRMSSELGFGRKARRAHRLLPSRRARAQARR